MPQLLLPGFPDGAIRLNPVVSVLKKEGHVTYFIGPDNYFSHASSDQASERFALASLIANRHLRVCEVERSPLGISRRTLQNWLKQLEEKGPNSFFLPRHSRGASVLTPEMAGRCAQLWKTGWRVAEVARRIGIGESTLRKALQRGAIPLETTPEGSGDQPATGATTKSERSRKDAEAAEGMGTACTRADERLQAAIGLLRGASARHEHSEDVALGGVLAGLPALCANGLLSGLGKYLNLPEGYYTAMQILITMGCMALARIKRPEGLRHVPPGELGKVLGLDRVPEVRTLRAKIKLLAHGQLEEWARELSRVWMEADPEEAGYLYLDGQVRVYHGTSTTLPRRFVSREKLCLRGTTDYWVNDALGNPFFVLSKTVTEGLGATLVEEIVPRLLADVPGQPTEQQLAADPLLYRFVVIFDREGATHSLLSQLWAKRVAAITYRKGVEDRWPENEFSEVEVPVPGGGTTRMRLAAKQTLLSAGGQSLPVLEVRRLTETRHQTAIISTARSLDQPVVAGRMFTRWCQENFFAYRMQHYDLDGLTEYGDEAIPGTVKVINPAWRTLAQALEQMNRRLRSLRSKIGATVLQNEGRSIQVQAEQVQDLQRLEADAASLRAQKKATPQKVRIDSLPEKERPRQLLPLAKKLTDTVKMIAYRAETALVGLLRRELAKEDEARAMIRELFVSAADLLPNDEAQTLTVKIHRMASPIHDRAMSALLAQLTQLNFCHPETGMRMLFELA